MPVCRQGGLCKLSWRDSDPWEYSERLAMTWALSCFGENLGVCSFVTGLCSWANDRYFNGRSVRCLLRFCIAQELLREDLGGPRMHSFRTHHAIRACLRAVIWRCGFCSVAWISFSSDQPQWLDWELWLLHFEEVNLKAAFCQLRSDTNL